MPMMCAHTVLYNTVHSGGRCSLPVCHSNNTHQRHIPPYAMCAAPCARSPAPTHTDRPALPASQAAAAAVTGRRGRGSLPGVSHAAAAAAAAVIMMAGSRSRAQDRGPVWQRWARCSGGMAAAWLAAVTVLLLLLSSLPGQCRAAQAEGTVRAVTSSNWSVLLEGQWMVTFYAPWCPACQQFQSEWESFAKQGSALNVNVAKVDVTEEPGLSGRFFVTTLPTIFHAQDGVFRRYHGSRMVEDLHTFISEKKWKVIEPVAGWKSPSSILMSGMAGLFHLSGWIRQTHNYFTGPLGIPAWGSYIIFIVATLLIGLTLGLILVLLTDCFCPAKPKYEVVRSEISKEEVEILDQDPKDASEERKAVSDDDDAIEEENEDENEDDLGEENKGDNRDNSGTEEEEEEDEDSAVEKSETGDEEDPSTHIQQPSTPESESALRQRKSEAVDSGH